MKKINIIYWSGTGNTENMANLIAEGAKQNSTEVEVINVSDASYKNIKNAEICILGCPAMGDEILEECEMEPFIEEISSYVKGKKVALFGSYGWGNGQWMANWEQRMRDYGVNLLDEGLIIQGEPEGEMENQCIEFGKRISEQ